MVPLSSTSYVFNLHKLHYMKNQLTKIFIIESTGLGGIAHYTYHLANSLANLNNSVTVYTSKSELSHFKRNFGIKFSYG